MGFDSPTHWLIVAAVLLALFGYKQLPDITRSVGRSLRIFKTEMKGLTDEKDAGQRSASEEPTGTPAVAAGGEPAVAPETVTSGQPVNTPLQSQDVVQ